MSDVDIFGEYHIDYERDRIEKEILKRHSEQPYEYLLSEEVGVGVYFSNNSKLQGISNKSYSIGPRSFMLSLKLNLPLVGIDEWEEQKFLSVTGERVDTITSFKIREKRMLEVITWYLKQGYRCAVIVGDSHLRTTKSVLGNPSIINTLSVYSNVSIVRSPLMEIE